MSYPGDDWEPPTVTAWSNRGKRRGAYGSKALQRTASLPVEGTQAVWHNQFLSQERPEAERDLSEDGSSMDRRHQRTSSLELPPKPLRRSHSLALGTPSSIPSVRESSNSLEENSDPNWPHRRGGKMRPRRRASTIGSVSTSSPVSTPTRSTPSSSNRKRSPSSLEWSTSSLGRRTRSRSRLLSPEDFADLPFAPNLNSSIGNLSSAGPSPPFSRGSMDVVDSDSDATRASPDSSFDEDNNHNITATPYTPFHEKPVESREPPNPKDLAFLIKALEKEQARICESWNVVAHHQWTSPRRTHFFAWTKRLGFALKPVGNGGYYASISKAKGRLLLERLHSGDVPEEPSLAVRPVPPAPPVLLPDLQADHLADTLAALTVQENRSSIELYQTTTDLYQETPRPYQETPLRPGSRARSHATPLAFDCILETPLNSTHGWGSRPVPGRDWGGSTRCPDEILATLTARFETTAGLCEPMPLLPFDFDAMDMTPTPQNKALRKRKQSFAKHNRVSLCAAFQPTSMVPRKSLFLPAMRESIDTPSLLFEHEFPVESHSDDGESWAKFDALTHVLGFLTEGELLCRSSLVCTTWADTAAGAHAENLLASAMVELSWNTLLEQFPWGSFLSEGSFKQVYRVQNASTGTQEAISVMDNEAIVDESTIGAELAVSALLSSLARRGICPNFIILRGTFTCAFAPPHWGSALHKKPKGKPRQPKLACSRRYQFIRMELCAQGDAEEYLKRQSGRMLSPAMSQIFLFQIAFALHAAADRFSLKHYDLKLLNVFVQDISVPTETVLLRYALGSHTFSLRMKKESAVLAKLADYGTANTSAESNGQPVTIAQFTTLENTPPDFMILGDQARQGHGHDSFGLGLCMLHLFTGHEPYEELMEDVLCPPNLKKRLRAIWEDEQVHGFDAIRSVILSDVYKDEAGNIVEGEPDETLYDTFYRFLVLFGIPDEFQSKKCPLVWKALKETLRGARNRSTRSDAAAYTRDCKKFSVREGTHDVIAHARQRLDTGGMELLFSLCSFDPNRRSSAMDVLNSPFMENLRESHSQESETVFSYNAFATR